MVAVLNEDGSEVQTTPADNRRGNIVKFVICLAHHPVHGVEDMYWDGSVDMLDKPEPGGTKSLLAARRLDGMQQALALAGSLPVPNGYLPPRVVAVRRTVSWTLA